MVAVPIGRVCDDLLELLGGVSDGQSGQGRDHPVSVVLALAAAAVVAGMKGYTAITGWVGDVPAAVLAELYLRAGFRPAGAGVEDDDLAGAHRRRRRGVRRRCRRLADGPGRLHLTAARQR
jgi:hypothetical protein